VENPCFAKGTAKIISIARSPPYTGPPKMDLVGLKNKSATNDSQSRSNHNSARMVELAQLVCSPRHRG